MTHALFQLSLFVAMPTCYFVSLLSDPNRGLDVPATWPRFDSNSHQYLEINSEMNRGYVRQRLRMRYVHFWGNILPQLSLLKFL